MGLAPPETPYPTASLGDVKTRASDLVNVRSEEKAESGMPILASEPCSPLCSAPAHLTPPAANAEGSLVTGVAPQRCLCADPRTCEYVIQQREVQAAGGIKVTNQLTLK